LGFFYFNWFFI